jgi:polyisoprenoid-binding protein YceI
MAEQFGHDERTHDMSLPLTAGNWTLDQTHSTIEFGVRHLGISKVRGRFHRFDATVNIGETLETTQIGAQVDLSSVDTNNSDRDAHLRSSDFFDTATHPTMTFSSTSISDKGDGNYVLHGDLTLNGRTNLLDLDVEFHGTAIFPVDGSSHAGFTATGSISRREFGIEFNVPLAAGGFVIGDKVTVELDLQLLPA